MQAKEVGQIARVFSALRDVTAAFAVPRKKPKIETRAANEYLKALRGFAFLSTARLQRKAVKTDLYLFPQSSGKSAYMDS